MKANDFVKKFGWDEARKQIKKPTGIHGAAFDYQFMDELKRLVESHELVEYMGGIGKAKEQAYVLTMEVVGFNLTKIEKAIVDVESCK